MLHKEDWLPQAKRLAVGMKVRVRHGRERRPNMVIGNDQGHWWAWCMACKEGGREDKEHVLLGGPGRALEEPTSLEVPPDLRPVLGSDYEAVVGRFLASKGMMYPFLPKLWYSEARQRLCLQDDARHWHGRDLTGRSNAKWLHYGKDHLIGEVGPVTIITEDIFSMYKLRFALRGLPYGVASTLGAGCSTSAALALKSVTRLVWAYDGDAAGDAGFKSGSKRMQAFVPKQYRARPPEGMDPKDMECQALRDMITEAML